MSLTPMIHLPSINSTNTYLHRMAAENPVLEPFTAVRADYQTAGRGQVGNTWESACGQNLLMSVYLRPSNLDVHEQFYLSMAVSLAVVDTVRYYVPNAMVKWPNDIYVGNKKLAGILIENTLCHSQIFHAIVGLGLNVNQTEFVSNAPNPISLRQLTCKELSVEQLGEEIIANMQIRMAMLEARKWQQLAAAYFECLLRADGHFYAFVDDGGEFRAKIKNILPTGHLVLADEADNERIYAFNEVQHVF